MAPPRKVEDSEIIEAIDSLRSSVGVVTYRDLADTLGLSVTQTFRRVSGLREVGVVLGGERLGDLRVAAQHKV